MLSTLLDQRLGANKVRGRITDLQNKMDDIESEMSDLEDELSKIEGAGEKGPRCFFCGCCTKNDDDVFCFGCLLHINELLSQGLTVEQMACGIERTLPLLRQAEIRLNIDYGQAKWNYRRGREAARSAFLKCYYPYGREGEL